MAPSSDKTAARAINERAIVALGSNLPHAGLEGAALLAAAIGAMRRAGLAPLRVSSAWASPAWPPNNPNGRQPDFVNAVVEIETGGRSPEALLATLLEIERAFGRVRGARWAARTLDLDLIDLGGLVHNEPDPILPHPRAHERAFVLVPLAEMAPEWRHPVLGQTAAELRAALPGEDPQRLGPVNISGA